MSGAAMIEAHAAQWLMRREQPEWSVEDQTALDAWLEESFAHKAAYWRLEAGWQMVDRIGALGLTHETEGTGTRRSWPGWKPAAIAASLFAVVTASALYLSMPAGIVVQPQRYSTDVGKQSTLKLADGSMLELNTSTNVRVNVSDKHREIWIDRGEAYFEVEHKADTPFVVHAGSRTVTVLGTKFVVRRDGDALRIAVVEGRVRLDADEEGQSPSAFVSAGNIALAQGDSTLVSRAPDLVDNALGWRSGMLVFDQITLADAVREFNRYNSTQLLLTDPALGAIRIGGTFRTSNAEGFASLLSRAYGLRVQRDSDKIIIGQ